MELQVFIEAGCELCDWALAIVRDITQRFPSLKVTVLDIGKTNAPIPDAVFAVPTYLLDGRVVSMGNPAFEELARMIEAGTRSAAGDSIA